MPRIEIDQEELIAHYDLIEKLNDFLHQPSHFEDVAHAQKVASEIYPELHKAYYETIWGWLPSEVQQKLTDR